MKLRIACRIIPLLAVLAFAACETTSQSLYSWGSYETQVYAYLTGESRDAQIAALEKDLRSMEKGGKAVAPGFYAHLGMLYADAGYSTMAVACFKAEKELFPEAAVYMDFILGGYEANVP